MCTREQLFDTTTAVSIYVLSAAGRCRTLLHPANLIHTFNTRYQVPGKGALRKQYDIFFKILNKKQLLFKQMPKS